MSSTGENPVADQSSWRPGLDSLMIERATVEHVPYLRRLKEAVMASRYRPAENEQEFERWRDVYCTEAYFRGVLADPDAMMLCIGSLREPVGMVVLHRRPDHLEIDDLLCLHAGRGDGTRLLKACMQYAEAWRKRRVLIDIYPDHERAERFLERLGFARVGEAANDLGRPMDRYERQLSADG